MQIDWFTLAAQIVNFLILMVLLRLVLYDRVLAVIRRRDAEVSEQFERAEQKENEAREMLESLRRERDALDQERVERLQEIEEDVSRLRAEMLRDLREEVQRTRENWRESLSRERDAIVHDTQERFAILVATAVEQALSDLAGKQLEEQIIEQFLGHITEAGEEDWDDVREALRANPDDVTIRTAAEPCEAYRDRIIDALENHVSPEIEPEFEVDPSLLAGIEIQVHGQTLGWNLKDYARRLRADFTEAINAELEAGT